MVLLHNHSCICMLFRILPLLDLYRLSTHACSFWGPMSAQIKRQSILLVIHFVMAILFVRKSCQLSKILNFRGICFTVPFYLSWKNILYFKQWQYFHGLCSGLGNWNQPQNWRHSQLILISKVIGGNLLWFFKKLDIPSFSLRSWSMEYKLIMITNLLVYMLNFKGWFGWAYWTDTKKQTCLVWLAFLKLAVCYLVLGTLFINTAFSF